MSIEEKIIDKIIEGKDREYNLSIRDRVKIKTENGNRLVTYYLWTSPIFKMISNPDYEGKIIQFSMCGWGSQTTKERLSALLYEFADCYLFRKNWIHYLRKNGKYYKVNEGTLYTIRDGKIVDTLGKELEEIKDFKI